MNILPEIDKISNELKKIFKDLHQHPELGFEEVRTSEIVKKRLQDFGVDEICLLYTSPSPRDATLSRMPSSA